MRKRRYEALLIDFYGTICAGDREAVEATCAHIVESCGLDLTPPELAIRWGEQFFSDVDQSNHDAFRTLNECEIESLRTTLARFGCTADPEPLVAPLEEYWLNPEIYEDAIAFLESVRLPVCCVSNADTEPLRAAMDRHGLVFDAVITSEDARAYKPDAEIFRQALSALDVSPEATIHVGDSLHSDIGGASMLGISTAWIRRDSRIHDIGNSHPDWTFATLTEMSGII